MKKFFRKHLFAIGFFAIAISLAFFAQNVYAGITGDECERSNNVCTPNKGSVCYYWLDGAQLPCIVYDAEYIDKNDSEHEQDDVNR